MSKSAAEFMRFSAHDPVALARSIAETRAKLSASVQAGDVPNIIDTAADLGSMLTTARMEVEAVQMLENYSDHAETNAQQESAGWFWNSYATALQYCNMRLKAEHYFIKAVELAKISGWRRLEALALHHWGRSLVEQERFAEARLKISEALAIRIELNEPRQESSIRALAELSSQQNNLGHPRAPGDA